MVVGNDRKIIGTDEGVAQYNLGYTVGKDVSSRRLPRPSGPAISSPLPKC